MRITKSMAPAAITFVLALVAHASPAWADFVTYSASSGNLSASVKFEISGGNLIVTLTNTSSADMMQPADVLTGVFFSLPGSLTAVSANVASGSWVNYSNAAGDAAFPNVAGEWAYKSGINVNGANSGLSSAGLNVFGPGDIIGSPNLEGASGPNGLNYGIASAGDDPTTGNGGLVGTPLVQNSVVFVLSGWNANWTLSNILNVSFQYGTALNEPNLAVPEPGVLALLAVGLLGFAFAARRTIWA